MTDKTIKQRVARYEARNADKGLARVKVIIPAERREELHRIAAQWRQEHGK